MKDLQFNRRRKMLPWWMLIFIWIFMLLGASSILMRFFKIIGVSFWFGSSESSIYGMETYESHSLLALFISSLLIFKGITSFVMWTEKKWAIRFGIIDASIGILICVIMMFIEPIFQKIEGKWDINLRFELLFLIPYLIKCIKLREGWEKFDGLAPGKTIITVPQERIKTVIAEKEPEKIVEEKIIEEKIDKEDHSRFMPK